MKTWVKLVLVFGVLAAGLAWVFLEGQQEDARRTAKGTAVVTAVELEPDDESSSLDETRLDVRVPAGGTAIDTADTLPGDRTAEFSPGQTVTVCYDPNDPADLSIELDPTVTCGA